MLEISSDLKIMIVVDERYYELSNMCLFCLFLASGLLSMLQMKKCNNPTKIFATETISLLTKGRVWIIKMEIYDGICH